MPEMMISIMDRRDGWASIVCLVGGGQEIGVGEVGLGGWFSALVKCMSSHWKAYAPYAGSPTSSTCGAARRAGIVYTRKRPPPAHPDQVVPLPRTSRDS